MKKLTCLLLCALLLFGSSSFTILAAGTATVTFDKSVKADAANMDLVITEVLVDTVSGDPNSARAAYDAFEYIEIYNRGDVAYDLSLFSIVMANNVGLQIDQNIWLQNHKFTNKVNLVRGNVYAQWPDKNFSSAHSVVNPQETMIEPGEFAIVWFWNTDCYRYSDYLGVSLAAPDPEREGVFFPQFRDFYNKNREKSNTDGSNPIPDDMLIMVAMGATTICGDTSSNKDGFNLANSGNRMYALVDRTFQLAENGLTASGKLNSKIKCLFQWGKAYKGEIPNVDNPQVSTIYVPSDQEPYLFNRGEILNAAAGATPVQYEDYAAKDRDKRYEVSYNEVSCMTYWEMPTPGYMMPYQWVYVDEARTPDTAKMYTFDGNEFGDLTFKEGEVNDNWRADAFAALEKAKLVTGEDVNTDETQREEIDYSERDEFNNQRPFKGTDNPISEAEQALLNSIDAARDLNSRYTALCAACQSVSNGSSSAEFYNQLKTRVESYNDLCNASEQTVVNSLKILAETFPSSNNTFGQLSALIKTTPID